MAKQKQLDVWIDRLTNSIVNTISGDSLPTEVIKVTAQDLKLVTKSRGWNFNWKGELKKKGIFIYKLVILGNENIIQGLISLEDRGDHIFVNIVENAPFNIGKKKVYEGVPGNLFAYACRLSWDNGNQGLVSFVSKSKLVDHYEKSLGAIHVGGFKMVIFPKPAFQLYKTILSIFSKDKKMKLGIEPKGIDFVVEPTKQTKADRELISKVIAHYMATGEILRAPTPKAKQLKSKKELITKP